MNDNEPGGLESTDTKDDRIAQLEQKIESVTDELAAVKTELGAYRDAVSKRLSGHEDMIEDIEQLATGSKPSNGGGDGPETPKQSGESDEMLPIERFRQLKEQDNEHPALPTNGRASFDRALAIYEHFGDWSKRTPKGRTITDNLKALIETATEETLAWKQVYRACRKLAEWSKGTITFKKTNRHGWILVQERASSVPTG